MPRDFPQLPSKYAVPEMEAVMADAIATQELAPVITLTPLHLAVPCIQKQELAQPNMIGTTRLEPVSIQVAEHRSDPVPAKPVFRF